MEVFKLEFSLSGWKSFLLFFVFAPFQLMAAVYCLGAIRRVAKPLLFLAFVLVALRLHAAAIILTTTCCSCSSPGRSSWWPSMR